jgi:hypothetical protein
MFVVFTKYKEIVLLPMFRVCCWSFNNAVTVPDIVYDRVVAIIGHNLKYFHGMRRTSKGRGKVKFTLEQAMEAQRGNSVLSLTSALDGAGWSPPSDRFTFEKRDLVPRLSNSVCSPKGIS